MKTYRQTWYSSREHKTNDLNGLRIAEDRRTKGGVNNDYRPQADYSTSSGPVSVYFKDLESNLIKHIQKADAVVGCVAWLTNFNILNALSKVSCSVVIQKEDLWRPDMGAKGDFKQRLRAAYNKLGTGIDRYYAPGIVSSLNVCGDPTWDGIRCVGNLNTARSPSNPRAHHKFLVFCQVSEELSAYGDTIPKVTPYAVWTGSYNFTKNGGASFQNAVYIDDPVLAQAYANEYAHIYAVSEPLDFEPEWVAPEYRIGT